MALLADGEKLTVAKSGPDYLILTEPAQVSAGEAELTVTVDGENDTFKFGIVGPVNGRRVELCASSMTHPPSPATIVTV